MTTAAPTRIASLSKQLESLLPADQSSTMLSKGDRTAIFVDASNIFYAASKLNIRIDYGKLKQYIQADHDLVGAYFYTGVDLSKAKERSFLQQVEQAGYHVIGKKLIRRSDGSKKANVDVEIALDMYSKAIRGHYDTAILVSGDGDFAYAIHAIQKEGIRVEVIALSEMASRSLTNAADRFTDLGAIKHKIQKYPFR